MEQRTVNEYLKSRYGKKLYKIGDPSLSVSEQIESGKRRVRNKLPADDFGYIAYFQAFTNTYGPIERLKKIYTEAAEHEDIEIISIATRPDCLQEDILDLISEINRIKPVWIELGLQTIHEKTAEYIRRGYPLSVYDEAVRKLRERGIETIVHVILGLPGETKEDILSTVKYVGDSGVEGIKLQLLHVLRGIRIRNAY